MMGYAVGVDFGSVLSMAGIVKWDNGSPSTPERVRVTAPVPSVAYVNSNNKLLLGNCAYQLGVGDPQRTIRDFKGRLGDPVPIMVDDWSEQPENIIAAMIRQIVDDIAAAEGAPPDAIAITHPASWGAYKQELLAGALTGVGLADCRLVPEPQAAATYAARATPSAGRTVIVYDLGAGSFEAAVMARVGDGGFEMLGQSHGLEWLGGRDFDQAVFSRIQRAAGLKNLDSKALDTNDKALLASLRRLRQDCTAAKELLSIDTEATITVQAAGRRTRIRLVRSEFEELIREAIEDTVDTTRRAISSAGLALQDIDAIVLVGGSSRIPLVAQLVSAEFSLPIVVDASPEASTSLGAAWLARAALQAKSAVSPDSPAVDSAGDVDAQPAAQAPSLMPTTAGPASNTPRPPRKAAPAVAAAAAIVPPPAVTPPTVPPTPPNGHPTPVPGGNAGPVGRRDQVERHGRHRRKGIRRYWIHVAGIIAAVAVIVSAGSALAVSEAGNRDLPVESRQANGGSNSTSSVSTSPAIATTPAAAAPDLPGQNHSGVSETPAAASPAPVTPGSTTPLVPWLVPDVTPNAVNAPAVIVNLSELLPAGSAATDPSRTGVSSATP